MKTARPCSDSLPAGSESQRVRLLLRGHVVTQILGCSVRLGVFDALASGGQDLQALSERIGIPGAGLQRFLRALQGLGLVRQSESLFHSTAEGALLQRDGIVGAHALLCGGAYYTAWSQLEQALKTGKSAFGEAFGCSLWECLDKDPVFAECFTGMMGQNTSGVGTQLSRVYPLPDNVVIADLGAGDGSLLFELLESNPSARGVAVEQQAVMRCTEDNLRKRKLGGRCEVVTGDLLEAVPAKADIYVLKSVIHNWKDEDAIRILKNCERAMCRDSRLLLIERPMREQPRDATSLLSNAIQDLTMLVLFGAHDRTLRGYASLLQESGLSIEQELVVDANLIALEARR